MSAASPAPKVWRGRFFEDFAVGDVFRSRFGRTVTEQDNLLFTCLTMNTNPVHFDAPHAESTRFGRILVNSSRGLNQRGEVVVEFRRAFMAYRRSAPQAADRFPEPAAGWTV